MRVVLVDDRRSALLALETSIVEIENIDVVNFTVPADALSYCRDNQVDLIIIDHMTPFLSGIDIIQSLKTPLPAQSGGRFAALANHEFREIEGHRIGQ